MYIPPNTAAAPRMIGQGCFQDNPEKKAMAPNTATIVPNSCIFTLSISGSRPGAELHGGTVVRSAPKSSLPNDRVGQGSSDQACDDTAEYVAAPYASPKSDGNCYGRGCLHRLTASQPEFAAKATTAAVMTPIPAYMAFSARTRIRDVISTGYLLLKTAASLLRWCKIAPAAILVIRT